MDNFEHDGVEYVEHCGERTPLVTSSHILTAADWACLMWFEDFNHELPYDWGCNNYRARVSDSQEHLRNAQLQVEEKCDAQTSETLSEAIYMAARAEYEIPDHMTDRKEVWAIVGQNIYERKRSNLPKWKKKDNQARYIHLTLDNSKLYLKHITAIIKGIEEAIFPVQLPLESQAAESRILLQLESKSESYRIRDIANSVCTKINAINAIKETPESPSPVIQMLYDMVNRHRVFDATASTLNTSVKS